jgi:hypothetical protein
MDTGSREENATNQKRQIKKFGVFYRFRETVKGSSEFPARLSAPCLREN